MPRSSFQPKELRLAFTLDFCESRAREAAEAASSAKLGNVRERELRSEAAWRAVANQIVQVEKKRGERLAEQARTAQEANPDLD